MAYEYIHKAVKALPAAEAQFQPEWQATKFMVGGKMFAMLGGDKEQRPILTVKLPPERGELVRREHPGDIVPGYYMNKQHWNSVYLGRGVDEAQQLALLREAYATGLQGLSAKQRKALLGE